MPTAEEFLANSPETGSAASFLDGDSAESFLDSEDKNAYLRTMDALANASGKVTGAIKSGAENVVQGAKQGFWQLPASVNRAVGLESFPGTQEAEQQAQAAAQEHEAGMEGSPFWERVGKSAAYGLGQLGATLPVDVAMGGGLKALAPGAKILEAIPSFALGMGVRKAGDEGALGFPEGVAEGLAMHGVGGLGQSLPLAAKLPVQAAGQGALAAGMTTADSLAKSGQLPTAEQFLESAATGAAMGVPFSLAPGKMGVNERSQGNTESVIPDLARTDPARFNFWDRINGTASDGSTPGNRMTSDQLAAKVDSNSALSAFVQTYSDLVSAGHIDIAGKLSISSLDQGEHAAGSKHPLGLALDFHQSRLTPEERNTFYVFAAQNGLSANVKGEPWHLSYVGPGAKATQVVTSNTPTDILRVTPPESQPTGDVPDFIVQAANQFGVDPDFLYRNMMAESGGRNDAAAATSSARGLWQFTDGDWKDLSSRPELQALGVTADRRNDPMAQALAAAFTTKRNADILRQTLGREPTDADLYMTAFLGSSGGPTFLTGLAQNPSDAAINHASAAAVRANHSIFYGPSGRARSLAEVYDLMAGKVQGGNRPAATALQGIGEQPLRPELAALRQDMESRATGQDIPGGAPSQPDAAGTMDLLNGSLGLANPLGRQAELDSLRQDIMGRDVASRAADEMGAPVPAVAAERLGDLPALPSGGQDFALLPDAHQQAVQDAQAARDAFARAQNDSERNQARQAYQAALAAQDQARQAALADAARQGSLPGIEPQRGQQETVVPQPEPTVQAPAHEGPVDPEPRAYVDAQVRAMADPRSEKKAVLITPGTPFPSALPKGTHAFVTEHGTVLTLDPTLRDRLPYNATDAQMGDAVLNYAGGRPLDPRKGVVIRALDEQGIPVGEVHVDKADKATAMAAMKGLSPVDKAVMVPLRQALADRVKGLQSEANTLSSIKTDPQKIPEIRGFLTGDPVVTLQGNEVPRFPKLGQLAQAVGDLWAKKYGNKVVNPELGEIVIDRRGAKTSVAHGMSAEKGAAFAAVPDILSKGKVLGGEAKGDVDGFFVGAPVRVAGKDYVGMALVKKDANGQRFYLHEVVLKEKLQGSIKTRAPEISGERPGGTAGAFRKILDTIFSPSKDETSQTVKNKSSEMETPAGPKGSFRKEDSASAVTAKGNPVTRQSLQKALADTPFHGAIVLDSPADLPDRGLRDYMERTGNLGAKGVYDIQTGKAYVFAGNHADMADALVTARDEMFHRGIFRWAEQQAKADPKSGPAFKQLNAFMNTVRQAKRTAVNAWLEKNGYGELKNTNYGANEWLTHAASYEAPHWYDRYVATVLKYAREFGKAVGFDFKLTDTEIRDWSRRVTEGMGEDARVMGDNHLETLFRKAASDPVFKDDGMPSESTWELIVRKVQDRMNRLAKTVGYVEGKLGRKLPDALDAALQENLYHGRVEEKLRRFETDHVKPLIESMKITGSKLADLEDALYALHAKRRNEVISERTKGENASGSGLTDEQAQGILDRLRDAGKLDTLMPLVHRVWDINKARLALLESSGLESPEAIKLWKETYGENYVPLKSGGESAKGSFLRTLLGEDSPQRMRVGSGYDIRGRESRHATGRHTEAADLLANVLAQYEETVIRAEKNKIGQSFLGMVLAHDEPKLWEADKTPVKAFFNDKTGLVETKKDPRYKLADNVLSVKVGGTEHLITINDPILARAMKNLGAEKGSQLLRLLGTFNRYQSLINTSLDPEFVVSNLVRDAQTANLNLTAEKQSAFAAKISKDVLTGKPIRGIFRALREQDSAAKDEWAQWFNRYREVGAKVGFFGLRTVEDQAKRLETMLAGANGDKLAGAKEGIRALGDFISDMNGSVENALRLSYFRRLVESGVSEDRAASAAKELTVNFNKRGEMGPTLNALYLFANASIQGNARILKALCTSKRGAAIAAGVISSGFAVAMMNRMLGGQDDDGQSFYDKIDDSTKSRNLILMKWWKNDGSYFKIPLPYGYNVLKVIGDKIEGMTFGRLDPMQAAVGSATAFVDAFNPLGDSGSLLGVITPSFARPLVDIKTNTDFGGNPIKPDQPRFGPKVPESQLAWSTVSKPAKWIAEQLNALTGGNEFEAGKLDVSPEVLEYLWGTYTGGVMRFLNRASNLGMNLADGTEPATKDVPFLRRVAGEQSPFVTSKQFREAADLIHVKENAYMSYRASDPLVAKEYRKTNVEDLALSPILKDIENELKPLTTKRNEILASATSQKQKDLELKGVDNKIQAVEKRFLKLYLSDEPATKQMIQKADKVFTLKEAKSDRAQILDEYTQAIADGDRAKADEIRRTSIQEYNQRIRENHLPMQLIKGSTLRLAIRGLRGKPSKIERRTERYLNQFDDSEGDDE